MSGYRQVPDAGVYSSPTSCFVVHLIKELVMPGYPEGLLKNRSVVKHGNYAVITPEGRYWYRGGINPAAVKALIPASLISILCVVVPGLEALADLPGIAFLKMLSNFSLLIAMLIGGWLYWRFMTRTTPR
jgi:permease for cytosine/purines uracil thiamine allantoin